MPRKTIRLKFPRKAEFSIFDILDINPVAHATIRKHVANALRSGIIADTGNRIRSGNRGRPAHLFRRVQEVA